MAKDTDDLFTYAGPHTIKAGPKHRATPDHENHKKAAPKGAHVQPYTHTGFECGAL
jgi:hypothetical protein